MSYTRRLSGPRLKRNYSEVLWSGSRLPWWAQSSPLSATRFPNTYIEAAGLKAIRTDEEKVGGIIQKPIFERLILCDYAVADLTTANANVYYELGVRHAMRPWSTVLIFANGVRLPFDLGPVRGLAYHLDQVGNAADSASDRDKLAGQLRAARREVTDSPLFQLLDNLPQPDISRLKTDVFREQAEYSNALRERLAAARRRGVDAVREIRDELGDLRNHESGVLVDLLLSFRDLEAWPDMVAVVAQMPEALARATLVREQYGLALNRDGQGEEAEEVLLTLINERGPSSESYGILGRVYKDRYEAADKAGNQILARGLLDKGIKAYVKGFERDWRDAYPGINAVQLMELREPPDPRRVELLPVVTYSVKRRIESKPPDYWDYATLLELAMLDNNEQKAMNALSSALAADPKGWQAQSTLDTVRRLCRVREARGMLAAWMTQIERDLEEAARTS
jgi:tetratricopeptide (TPR) repeat protein